MAFWSEAPLSYALQADRFDGDYFRPDDLEAIAQMRQQGATELASLCTVLNGKTPDDYDEGGNLSVVRSGDLTTPLIYPECEQPFLRAFSRPGRVRLAQGDVLISSIGMGSIGKISLVVDASSLVTVSEVTILRDCKHAPEYLFAYLSSSTGQAQIEREITGATGQQHLLKSKVGKILVPDPPSGIEQHLRESIATVYEKLRLARTAYTKACLLLEADLGLNELDLSLQPFYEGWYARVEEAGRFDAEYFNPRTQNIIEALSRDGLSIADVARLAKRKFRSEANVEFQYIEIAGVTGNGTADSNPVEGEEAPSRATQLVEPGDVITTTVRPIRRLSAIVTDKQDGYVCSSGFAVLRPEEIDPELLLVYLRLPLVCELLDLHTTASMYPAISTTELMKIPISLPDDATRQQIRH